MRSNPRGPGKPVLKIFEPYTIVFNHETEDVEICTIEDRTCLHCNGTGKTREEVTLPLSKEIVEFYSEWAENSDWEHWYTLYFKEAGLNEDYLKSIIEEHRRKLEEHGSEE